MKTKTSTRQKIFAFIKDFIGRKGYAPTVRDILRGCKLSTTSVVQHHLNKLEEEGYIHRDAQVFRSIRLAETEENTANVPLLGAIAAGSPIPVPDTDSWQTIPRDTLNIPTELIHGKKNIFALKVKGTSMIDAFIDDGDTVLMAPADSIVNGDMVAAWLKDKQEVTLKKFYREKGRIRLQPANRTMSPIYVNPANIEVQGKVIGVIRSI